MIQGIVKGEAVEFGGWSRYRWDSPSSLRFSVAEGKLILDKSFDFTLDTFRLSS